MRGMPLLEDVRVVVPRRPLFIDAFDHSELFTALPWRVKIGNVWYTVPAPMLFDGASIPRIFWRVLGAPLDDLFRIGALLHDACYKGVVKAVHDQYGEVPVERDEADDLMALLNQWNGTPMWKVRAMWETLQLCGGPAWKKQHLRYRDRMEWFHWDSNEVTLQQLLDPNYGILH